MPLKKHEKKIYTPLTPLTLLKRKTPPTVKRKHRKFKYSPINCPEGKILNPKTGRCVKSDGKLGVYLQLFKSAKLEVCNECFGAFSPLVHRRCKECARDITKTISRRISNSKKKKSNSKKKKSKKNDENDDDCYIQ